jgi:hypothetical protein
VVGLAALVDAVIEAPSRGWLSATTIGEAAAIGGFIAWELRRAHPMIDLRVFANRAFSGAAAAVALTFFALFGSLFALTQYLQLVHGYSALAAGVRVVIPSGLVLMGAGLAWLAQAGPTTPYLDLAGAVVVMGAGMGLVMAPASETIMSSLPAHQAGVGSAVNDTVREVGGALGVAVIGSVVSAADQARASIAAADAIAAHTGPAGPVVTAAAHQAYTTGMTHGFEVAAAVALVGAVATAWRIPGRVELHV